MHGVNDKSGGALALSISGMTCAGCASSVARILSRVGGVATPKVDFASGRVVITGGARAKDLIAAVEAAGYGAQLPQGAESGEQK